MAEVLTPDRVSRNDDDDDDDDVLVSKKSCEKAGATPGTGLLQIVAHKDVDVDAHTALGHLDFAGVFSPMQLFGVPSYTSEHTTVTTKFAAALKGVLGDESGDAGGRHEQDASVSPRLHELFAKLGAHQPTCRIGAAAIRPTIETRSCFYHELRHDSDDESWRLTVYLAWLPREARSLSESPRAQGDCYHHEFVWHRRVRETRQEMWYNQFTTEHTLVVSQCVAQGAHRVASRVFRELAPDASPGDSSSRNHHHRLYKTCLMDGGQTCAVTYYYGVHTPLLIFNESWTSDREGDKKALVAHNFRQPYLGRVPTAALVLNDRFWQMVDGVRYPTRVSHNAADRAADATSPGALNTAPRADAPGVATASCADPNDGDVKRGGPVPSRPNTIMTTQDVHTLRSVPAGSADVCMQSLPTVVDAGTGTTAVTPAERGFPLGTGVGPASTPRSIGDDVETKASLDFDYAMPIDFRRDTTYSFVSECRMRRSSAVVLSYVMGRGERKTRSQSGHTYTCPACDALIAEHDDGTDTPLTLDLLQDIHREHENHPPSLVQHAAFRDLCVLTRKPWRQLRREQWYAEDGMTRLAKTTIALWIPASAVASHGTTAATATARGGFGSRANDVDDAGDAKRGGPVRVPLASLDERSENNTPSESKEQAVHASRAHGVSSGFDDATETHGVDNRRERSGGRAVVVLDTCRRTDNATYYVARKTLREFDGRVAFRGTVSASHGIVHAPAIYKADRKSDERARALEDVVMLPRDDDADFFSWHNRDHVAAFVCSDADPMLEIVTLPAILRSAEPLTAPPSLHRFTVEEDAKAEQKERKGLLTADVEARRERYERHVWRCDRREAARPTHYCMHARHNRLGNGTSTRVCFSLSGDAPPAGPIYVLPATGDPARSRAYLQAARAYLDAISVVTPTKARAGRAFTVKRLVHGSMLEQTVADRNATSGITYNGVQLTVHNTPCGEYRRHSIAVRYPTRRSDSRKQSLTEPRPDGTDATTATHAHCESRVTDCSAHTVPYLAAFSSDAAASLRRTSGRAADASVAQAGDDVDTRFGKSILFRDATPDDGAARRLKWYRKANDEALQRMSAVLPVRGYVVNSVQRIRSQIERRALVDDAATDAQRWAFDIVKIAYGEPHTFLGDAPPGAWLHVLESKWLALCAEARALMPDPDTDLRNPPGTTLYFRAAFRDFEIRVAHLERLGHQTADIKAAMLYLGAQYDATVTHTECWAGCLRRGPCRLCVIPVDDCKVLSTTFSTGSDLTVPRDVVARPTTSTRHTPEPSSQRSSSSEVAPLEIDRRGTSKKKRSGDLCEVEVRGERQREEERACKRSTRSLIKALATDVGHVETRLRAVGFAGGSWLLPETGKWMCRHKCSDVARVVARSLRYAAEAGVEDVGGDPERSLADLTADIRRPFALEMPYDTWSIEFRTPEVSAFPGWFERVSSFFGRSSSSSSSGGKGNVPKGFALRRQDESGRDREGADSNNGPTPSVGGGAQGSRLKTVAGPRIYHKLVMGSNGMECAVELEFIPAADDVDVKDRNAESPKLSATETKRREVGGGGGGGDRGRSGRANPRDEQKTAAKRAPRISVAAGANHKRRIQEGRTLSVVPVLMQDGRLFFVHEYNKWRCTMCEANRCTVVQHCVCRMRACSDCSRKLMARDTRCTRCRNLISHVTTLSSHVIRQYRREAAQRHCIFSVTPIATATPIPPLSSTPLSPSPHPPSTSPPPPTPSTPSVPLTSSAPPTDDVGSNRRESKGPRPSPSTAPVHDPRDTRNVPRMDVFVSGKNVPRGEGKEELKPAFSARPSSSDVPQSLPSASSTSQSSFSLHPSPLSPQSSSSSPSSALSSSSPSSSSSSSPLPSPPSSLPPLPLAGVASAATEQEEAWEEDALFDGLGHMEEKRRYTLPWGVSCIDRDRWKHYVPNRYVEEPIQTFDRGPKRCSRGLHVVPNFDDLAQFWEFTISGIPEALRVPFSRPPPPPDDNDPPPPPPPSPSRPPPEPSAPPLLAFTSSDNRTPTFAAMPPQSAPPPVPTTSVAPPFFPHLHSYQPVAVATPMIAGPPGGPQFDVVADTSPTYSLQAAADPADPASPPDMSQTSTSLPRYSELPLLLPISGPDAAGLPLGPRSSAAFRFRPPPQSHLVASVSRTSTSSSGPSAPSIANKSSTASLSTPTLPIVYATPILPATHGPPLPIASTSLSWIPSKSIVATLGPARAVLSPPPSPSPPPPPFVSLSSSPRPSTPINLTISASPLSSLSVPSAPSLPSVPSAPSTSSRKPLLTNIILS